MADLEGELTPTELFEKECARVWESTRILETHLGSREEMLEYTQWYYSALVDLGYPNDCESNPVRLNFWVFIWLCSSRTYYAPSFSSESPDR